jgi:hypothetical protein
MAPFSLQNMYNPALDFGVQFSEDICLLDIRISLDYSLTVRCLWISLERGTPVPSYCLPAFDIVVNYYTLKNWLAFHSS